MTRLCACAQDKGAAAEFAAKQRAEMQRLLEDYYALDYEDNIGGLKTRFRYKQVPKSNFGLSAEDILFFSDKELNQVRGTAGLHARASCACRP